jgi:hypothetical protein
MAVGVLLVVSARIGGMRVAGSCCRPLAPSPLDGSRNRCRQLMQNDASEASSGRRARTVGLLAVIAATQLGLNRDSSEAAYRSCRSIARPGQSPEVGGSQPADLLIENRDNSDQCLT